MTAKQLSVCLTSVANFIMSDESNYLIVSIRYAPPFGWYVSMIPTQLRARIYLDCCEKVHNFRVRLNQVCFFNGLNKDLADEFTNPNKEVEQFVIY